MQTQARPIQQVNVKRPSRYTIGPEFVAEVGESEISRFRMRIVRRRTADVIQLAKPRTFVDL